MALNIAKYLNQKMIYFEKEGIGGSGQSTYKAPVEMFCRWDDITDENAEEFGRTVEGNSFLMTEIKLKVGSKVWLGTLEEYKQLPIYPKIPTVAQGCYEVLKVGHNPDIRGEDLLFTARV